MAPGADRLTSNSDSSPGGSNPFAGLARKAVHEAGHFVAAVLDDIEVAEVRIGANSETVVVDPKELRSEAGMRVAEAGEAAERLFIGDSEVGKLNPVDDATRTNALNAVLAQDPKANREKLLTSNRRAVEAALEENRDAVLSVAKLLNRWVPGLHNPPIDSVYKAFREPEPSEP